MQSQWGFGPVSRGSETLATTRRDRAEEPCLAEEHREPEADPSLDAAPCAKVQPRPAGLAETTLTSLGCTSVAGAQARHASAMAWGKGGWARVYSIAPPAIDVPVH